MKLIFISLSAFLIMTTSSLKAQNLISNGGFENYTGCPVTFSQIDSVVGWTVPTSYVSTDFFHTCAPLSSLVGVPVNQGTGYQFPHSGDGYAGLFIYAPAPDIREYISTELVSPLVANQCYQFEMYINILNGVKYTSDDIQVLFSDTLISGIQGYGVLNYSPQIENTPGNFPDTLNWTLVQMNYTASGGEKFIVIGNFKNDANTTIVSFLQNALPATYTYIDDVSLTICTGIETLNENNNFSVNYNQTTNQILIENRSGKTARIELFNMLSGKVIQTLFKENTEINTVGFATGIYAYRISIFDEIDSSGKLLLQ
ncbi:MAG: T9SS type A sorting domain-containing protein [Bacteroidia bacterium]|nr:T9SS type A sorting domain-containing protein [Bacteroidia bacterium]